MPPQDYIDRTGDTDARRLDRQGVACQLALGLGQTIANVPTGSAMHARVPIGANRAEVLAVSNATATLIVRRRVDQPSKGGAAELVVSAGSLALTATATGRLVLELPPDSGVVDCTATGMVPATATAVDAVITFWRQP